MKTTIDIPDTELKDAIRFTGAKTKKEAVVTAIREFNRRKRASEAVRIFGTFESVAANEEIEGWDSNEGTD
jgi:Arc/MetJ family transcription regulator